MKTILALAAALTMGTYCIRPGFIWIGIRHFNTCSSSMRIQSYKVFFLLINPKPRGLQTDNDTQLNLDLNYAYSIPTMPRLQVGGRVSYDKGTEGGRGDLEDYGLEVGAIVNWMADLQNSPYASLYLGVNWANTYGVSEGRKDEVLMGTLAVGKRFSMETLGIKHLTYTPEIALENLNSTTGSSLEYSQNIQLRFLQFSVFF